MQSRAADGGIVTSIYDLLGNQIKAVDAKGSTTLFGYDRLGRVIQTIRPITDRYRANDAMALEYTGTGNPVEYQSWDSLGRRLSQTNAAGEITRYTYDLTGNLLSTTLPMGQRTSNFYDTRGRQTAQLKLP